MIPAPARAQDQASRPWSLWAMPVIGSYSENGCASLCAGSSVALPISWQSSRLVLTARAAADQDDQDIWHVKDIGVVAGYGTRPGGAFHAHAGIGLGYGEASASAKSGRTRAFEAQISKTTPCKVGGVVRRSASNLTRRAIQRYSSNIPKLCKRPINPKAIAYGICGVLQLTLPRRRREGGERALFTAAALYPLKPDIAG